MTEQERSRRGELKDIWKPISICDACGTPQYRNEEAAHFVCLVCGGTNRHIPDMGSWIHVYSYLRIQRENALSGAMMLIRAQRDGAPILLTTAVRASHTPTRYRVERARTLLETTYNNLNRIHKVSKKETHD